MRTRPKPYDFMLIENCGYPEHWMNHSLENIEGEEWLPIAAYETLYEVSNMGRIKTLGRIAVCRVHIARKVEEKIKSQFLTKQGYCRVEISKGGKNRKFFVHRLVAFAFIENTEQKPWINHKKGRIRYNAVEELEWSTVSENTQHAYDVLGRKPTSPWKGCRKEDHPMYGRRGELAPAYGKRGDKHHAFGKRGDKSKSSNRVKCNETGVEYGSGCEAARVLGLRQSDISSQISGHLKNVSGLTFTYLTKKIIKKRNGLRPVVCVETQQTFDSASDAALALGVSVFKLSLVLNGKRERTGGFHFKYAPIS